MASEAQHPVKIQQCLFGYEDGHRLLASSLQLSTDAESMLLMLSDLAPGINEINAEGYWTGIPLASENYYALLHTWSAPEMPRPGCVWTHVLLVGFADIARFVDLAVLKKYSVRPRLGKQYNNYSKFLLADVTKNESTERNNDILLSYKSLLKVIRAIYNSDDQSYLFSETNEFDVLIFRVWSQQWPKLRRSFSFRTAGSLSEKSTVGVHFDFRVLSRKDYYASPQDGSFSLGPKGWEGVVVEDALSAKPTEFRRFLWRYGSDIHKGRERFSFLANLYVSTHLELPETISYESMLLQVAETLPDPEDGKALKSDLVKGEHNIYSLMPAVDPLDRLAFFIKHPHVKGLPESVDSMLPNFQKLWPTRSEEILVLSEQAINRKSILREKIFAQLVELIEVNNFFAVTYERPNLRFNLIRKKPSLLNSDSLLGVDQPELSNLLTLLPDDQQLVDQVIGRLIFLDDHGIAEEMFSHFPNIVMRHVVDAIEMIFSTKNKNVPRIWLQTITKSAPDFLRGEFIESSKSMDVLAVYAEVLGYRNRDVINAGPLPWALALIKAKDDICGKRRDKFYAFLLLLAIKNPLHGCEPIFERTFESMHSALASDKLDDDTHSMITESLPKPRGWMRRDLCHRLRIAVVNTYVNNKLDQKSFGRLTSDQKLANSLVNLVRKTKKGKSFLNKRRPVTKR